MEHYKLNLQLFAGKNKDVDSLLGQTDVEDLRADETTRITTRTPITTYKASDYLSKQGDLPENAALANAEADRPGPYQGKYDDQINGILNDILNRGEFKYDFNADPLYHQYAENYTNKGKLAAMDTLGMASAMTGGYGSTYGQQAAQQTYNGYMQDLSNQIPNLYQLAENTYWNNVSGKRADLGNLEGLDNTDYGRYRDNVGDWEKDRAYYYQKLRDSVGDLQYKAQYYAQHPELDPNGTKEVTYKITSKLVNYCLNNRNDQNGKYDIPINNGSGLQLTSDEIKMVNYAYPGLIKTSTTSQGNTVIEVDQEKLSSIQ